MNKQDLPVLDDAAEFDRLLQSDTFIIFKHSPICSVSSHALKEIQVFVGRHPDAKLFLVDVLGQRPLSRHIAQSLDVVHQSPQVIIVRESRAVWATSHFEITADAVAKQL